MIERMREERNAAFADVLRLEKERDTAIGVNRDLAGRITGLVTERDAALAEVDRLKTALYTLATGLRWEEELRAWVLTDLGALTRARQALAPSEADRGDK